jgi:hypothetical protein
MTAIMTYRQWMAETRRGAFTPRSSALKKIDSILKEYDESKSSFDLLELKTRLENWMKYRGTQWRAHTRNRGHTVSKLYRQVGSELFPQRYDDIPGLAVFQNHSKTMLGGNRNNAHAILKSIDIALAKYEATADDALKTYLTSQLFYITDTWLRLDAEENPKIDITQYPAVNELYRAVVDELCRLWGTTVNVLPQKLEEIFGKELTQHGRDIDWGADETDAFGARTGDRGVKYQAKPGHKDNLATYLKRIEVKKYQLTFEDGLVYMYPWWDKKRMKRWETIRADSSKPQLHWEHSPEFVKEYFSAYAKNPEPMFKNYWCGFVLSMDRRFYIAPHLGGFDVHNFFHSSYLAGNAVLCAGSIEIRNGIVTGIYNDSGHYMPSEDKLVTALETLRMYGVPQLNDIAVHYIYMDKGTPRIHAPMKAGDFLKVQGNVQVLDRMKKQFEERHPTIPRPERNKLLDDILGKRIIG